MKPTSELIMRSLFVIALTVILFGCKDGAQSEMRPIFIPELLDSSVMSTVDLTLNKAQHEFYSGVKSQTLGVNGSYLGPTVKLISGTTANLVFHNRIEEPTTIHGHGLHVDGNVDGGPQQVIHDGNSLKISIPVTQQAGTSWYHPHMMGKTAEHVHAGLAGMYIIEDSNSQSLDLPKTYGLNDIPLIVQDRSFSNGKMKPYSVSMSQMMDGLREDKLVVNGTVDAFFTAPKGWLRLRLLNASNARFYRFFFQDNVAFYKIATEGGFLNSPVEMNEIVMAPGERNEIMIDLSGMESVELLAEFLAADPADQFFLFSMFNSTQRVVEIRTDSSIPAAGVLVSKLNNIDPLKPQGNYSLRSFNLEMADDQTVIDMHKMFTINGKWMDMSRIDERVEKNQLEVWRITAEMMPHPFHIHGVSFQILSQMGKPPAEENLGWKDTIVVGEQPTEVIMKFQHEADEHNPYMYHCHILEHEDGGMMGQFTVQ